MTNKSDTCFSKKTGDPLTKYISEYDASDGAKYINFMYGNKLSPYRCNCCDGWHLSPSDRQTPSIQCPSCTDSNGYHKELYETNEGALQRANILYNERGVSLRVYECPHHEGWHLSKSNS